MQKHLLSLLVFSLLSITYQLQSQDYALSEPFGYGKDATGGAGGTVITVSSVSELSDACKLSGKYIILVSGTITFTSHLSIKPVDKTIIGLPGSKLYSAQQDKSNSGILYIGSGSHNVILRNLTFESPGAYDCDGWDNLAIDGGTTIWVDHCDFQDGVDGNFDNKGDADNITVSWCRFRYLKAPKAGGPGGSDDHRYTNLLGSSGTDAPADGTFSFTWAYNWWDDGCVERMLRCRNAEVDFISNYWSSSAARYFIGPQNVSIYAEGCYFEGLAENKIFYENYGGTNYCKFVDSYGSVDGVPADQGSVSAPTYPYTSFSYTDTKTFVTSACGAGATLEVNETTGEVYTACASDIPTLSLVSETATANQTVELGTAITDINYVFGGTATGATVTGLPDGITYNTNDSLISISGTIAHTATVQEYTYSITTDPVGATKTGKITAAAHVLAIPENFASTSTDSSATISWDVVENASGYRVNFCEPVTGEINDTEITTLLDNDTRTNGYFTLSSGDRLHTEASAGNSSSSCVPEGVNGTVYRTSSMNDFVLELVTTTSVSEITFGGRSSGTTSTRDLLSYTINNGDGQTTNISGLITAQECATEITITNLNLTQGDQIAFTFNGNVQLSYFLLTSPGETETCNEFTVTESIFTASGLSDTTLFNFEVKALSDSSSFTESAYSPVQQVTTLASEEYEAPTIELTSALSSTNQTVEINETIALISYDFGGSATNAAVTGLPDGVSSTVNGSTLTISGTVSATAAIQTYTYTVSTVPAGATVTGTITVVPQPLEIPTGLTATSTEHSVTITWNAVTHASEYMLELCEGSNCDEYTVSETTYTATSLSDNTSFSYRVKALSDVSSYSASGYSGYETISTLESNEPTSVAVVGSAVRILKTGSQLQITGVDVVQLDLYRIDGVKIKTVHRATTDVSELKTGLFILVIQTTKGEVHTQKFLLD